MTLPRDVLEPLPSAGVSFCLHGGTDVAEGDGLEFDQVFIPGLDEAQMPLLYELNQRPDQVSRELFEQQERSLLHVGATRAKKRVVISYSGNPSSLLG